MGRKRHNLTVKKLADIQPWDTVCVVVIFKKFLERTEDKCKFRSAIISVIDESVTRDDFKVWIYSLSSDSIIPDFPENSYILFRSFNISANQADKDNGKYHGCVYGVENVEVIPDSQIALSSSEVSEEVKQRIIELREYSSSLAILEARYESCKALQPVYPVRDNRCIDGVVSPVHPVEDNRCNDVAVLPVRPVDDRECIDGAVRPIHPVDDNRCIDGAVSPVLADTFCINNENTVFQLKDLKYDRLQNLIGVIDSIAMYQYNAETNTHEGISIQLIDDTVYPKSRQIVILCDPNVPPYLSRYGVVFLRNVQFITCMSGKVGKVLNENDVWTFELGCRDPQTDYLHCRSSLISVSELAKTRILSLISWCHQTYSSLDVIEKMNKLFGEPEKWPSGGETVQAKNSCIKVGYPSLWNPASTSTQLGIEESAA